LDAAAAALNYLLDDGESEAYSVGVLLCSSMQSAEFAEEQRDVRFCDACTRVPDAHQESFTACIVMYLQPDGSPTGELDRVSNQVYQNLKQTARVTHQVGQSLLVLPGQVAKPNELIF